MDTLTADRVVQLNMTNGDDLTVSTSFDALVTLNGFAQAQISSTVDYYNLIDLSDVDFTLFVDNGLYTLTVNGNVSLASVNEISSIDFTVYPNPTTNFLHLNIENYSGSFDVYDMAGKLLIQTTEKIIDMRSLSPGSYILHAGERVQKVIVE
jgi:hypothetical protein